MRYTEKLCHFLAHPVWSTDYCSW